MTISKDRQLLHVVQNISLPLFLSYLKQWQNAAEQRSPLISILLPIDAFLLGKNLFFSGLKQNFLYICIMITEENIKRKKNGNKT